MPTEVPRPAGDPPHPLVERLHALRTDPRVGLALLGCVAIAAGAAWFRAGVAPSAPPAAPISAARAAAAPTSTVARVVVHVTGAVRAPGVVTLPAGARVTDAVAAAGGASDGADLQRLNLAAHVSDGQRIAVPRVGEPLPADTADPSADARDPPGPVNVNTATVAQLDTLPGIGPALAAAIVREREHAGAFRNVDDLARVKGIGKAKLAQLRGLVTV